MPSNASFPASSQPAANAVHRGVDSAGAALHAGVDKVSEPAREAVERFSTAAHGTIDKIASTATQTVDSFSSQTRRVTQAPSQALAYSKSWIQGKPIQAVGAALALGFILGRLSGR